MVAIFDLSNQTMANILRVLQPGLTDVRFMGSGPWSAYFIRIGASNANAVLSLLSLAKKKSISGQGRNQVFFFVAINRDEQGKNASGTDCEHAFA